MQKNTVNVSVPLFAVLPVFVLFAACCVLATYFVLNWDGSRGSATLSVRGLIEEIELGNSPGDTTISEVLAKYGKPHGEEVVSSVDGIDYAVWMYEFENTLVTFYAHESSIFGIHYCKWQLDSANRWLSLDRERYSEFLVNTLVD